MATGWSRAVYKILVTFKYDPFGRRIYKSSSSGTSVYAYDGKNLVEETNSTGTVVARYAQTEETDEALAMLRSGTTSYYEQDGIDSVTSLSNAGGAVAQTYTFDSLGNQTASSGSVTNSFRYTGREFDPETNLYFYRARYYDPSVGPFLSEDPLGFDDGTNFYPYVGNSSTNFNDPFGLYKLKPKKHPVPPPSPQLDKFLNCLEGCVGKLAGGAGLPIVATSLLPQPTKFTRTKGTTSELAWILDGHVRHDIAPRIHPAYLRLPGSRGVFGRGHECHGRPVHHLGFPDLE
jgi:RHS repeat-associated protein